MKSLFILLFTISLTSCSYNYVVSKEELKTVPKKSTKVIAVYSQSPEETYSHLLDYFGQEGWPISSNKEAMQIIAGAKDVGGGAAATIMVHVRKDPSGSKATITGDWGLSAKGQAGMSAFGAHGISGRSKAIWEGTVGSKPGLVFEYMILTGKSISNATISYGN